MRTIALVSQKGGTGKSTLVWALAGEASRRKMRVLVVDGDRQRTLAVASGLAGEADGAPTLVCLGASMGRELGKLASGFDFVCIDTPGNDDAVARAAMLASDLVLLPCSGSGPDLWALTATARAIREAQKLAPAMRAMVVLSRVRPRTAVGKQARQAAERLGLEVCTAEICERTDFAAALSAGQAPAQYAPGSVAAAEVAALFDEVVGVGAKGHGKEASKRRPVRC